MLLIVLLVGISIAESDSQEWTVDGDRVYVNDSDIYIAVTPHTIHNNRNVTVTLRSKTHSGKTDIILGYEDNQTKPSGIFMDDPHNTTATTTIQNITSINTTDVDTCEVGEPWDKTSAIVTYNQTANTTASTTVCYDSSKETDTASNTHEFTHTHVKQWRTVAAKPNGIKFEHDEKSTWYEVKDIQLAANTTYTFQVQMELPRSKDKQKYDIGIKPGDLSYSDAEANGELYLLDPWYQNSDLQLLYHMNESSGPSRDFSTFNRDGTWVNGPLSSVTAGNGFNDNKALSFDSGSSQRIDTGADFGDDTNNLTVAAWVKMDDTSYNRFVSKSEGGGTCSNTDDCSYAFRYHSAGSDVRLTLYDSSDNLQDQSFGYDPGTKLVHLVGVYNGAMNNASLYVNGSLEATLETADFTMQNSARDVTVGARFRGGSYDQHMDGMLDEVRVFNVPLNSSWANNLYLHNDVRGDTSGGGGGDTTAPTITIHDPSNTTHASSTLDLNATADESVDTWQKSLDGGANETLTPNGTLSGLSDGSHNVTVYANDTDGNTGKATRHFTVDTTAPTVSYNADTTGSGTYSQSWINVDFSGSDSIDGALNLIEQFNGANTTSLDDADNTYADNHTGLSDGTYTYKAFAEDDAGNTGSAAERSITLDTTPPSTSDNWTLSGWQSKDQVHLELTASDTTSSVDRISYRVDGSSWTTVSGSSTTLTISEDGNHTVEYNATDTAGNVEATQTEYVALDTVAPSSSDNYTKSGWQPSSSETIEITASETQSGVDRISYRVNGGSWTTVAGSSAEATVSGDGNHTLEYNATDAAGNIESTNTEYVALDTAAPTTSDNWTVSGWQNKDQAHIELTCSDSSSGCDSISYRTDGGSWTTDSGSSTTVTITADGNTTLEYNSTDTVDNTEPTQTEYVALDTTSPAVSYTDTSTDSGTYSQDWIFINISATDTNSGLDWVRETFDGTNSTLTTTAGQYRWENHTGLSDGTYTVQGWANDTVSNYNFTAERTITIDTTAPTVTLHEPRNITYNSSTIPLNGTADESGNTWQYSLDGAANTSFSPNTTISSLAAGTYTLDVYSTDAAGNTGNATVTFTASPNQKVVLREGITIRQPDNNVQINVTSPFNVSNQLRTFSDATQFDATNWSISGTTGDFIGVHLDWFNDSATDSRMANYSVDTTDDNTVTFSWVNAVVDAFYDVFINGLFDTQQDANANGDFSFTEDSWSSGSTYDNFSLLHTSNGMPQITSTLFRDDRKQSLTRLEFDLDDRGESDLRSYRGDGSTATFTNSSLDLDVTLPVASTYDVTDQSDRTSGNTSVDISETDSGLQEDPYTHTLDTQQVNRSVTVCNNEITGLLYNLTFASHGTAVTAESFNGTIPATDCVTETGVWSGDWLTNEAEIVRKKAQNGSRVSNTSRQHFFNETAFQADNSQGFQFIGVDLSTQCAADTVGTASAGTSNLTTNCNNDTYSGDFINDTEFGFKPEPDQVTLGINYYGHRQLQLNNTQPVAWGAVNTTTGVTPPNKCSQANNTVVGLAAGTISNYTVRFSCPPGTLGSGTQEVKNISSDKERVWFNISNIEVYTNHTEDLPFRREVNWDNLKNPNERDGGTLEAYADGNQINVSIRDESGKFVIIIGRNHTNSSWHKGMHTAALTYTLSDDSTIVIDDGGGGGGGGGTTTTIIQNVTGDAYSWTVSTRGSGSQRFQFFGYPGRTFNAPLELENTGSGPVNLSLQCIDSDRSCQWVDLSTDNVQFDASSFTKTTVMVTGQVPLNATRNEYNFVIRVTDPSFNPQNPSAGGKGDVRFTVDMNRPLGILIERYGRLARIYTTIDAPEGVPLPEDAHGLPVPFVLIPLFFSGAVFAVTRAVDDSGGAVLAAHILLAVFVFILAAGLFPAWPIL